MPESAHVTIKRRHLRWSVILPPVFASIGSFRCTVTSAACARRRVRGTLTQAQVVVQTHTKDIVAAAQPNQQKKKCSCLTARLYVVTFGCFPGWVRRSGHLVGQCRREDRGLGGWGACTGTCFGKVTFGTVTVVGVYRGANDRRPSWMWLDAQPNRHARPSQSRAGSTSHTPLIDRGR